jgi:endonuclease-3 related protein
MTKTKPNTKVQRILLDIYNRLYQHFGPRHWWPAKTTFEIILGAILTQNTAWGNVEKAIANLKKEKLLSIDKLLKLTHKRLAKLIRPSGYYNEKAKKLIAIAFVLKSHYQAKLNDVKRVNTKVLREQLLDIKGIGPETADSILLYAFNRPIFVIDAYTRRIFSRLKMIRPKDSYYQIQSLFMDNLTTNAGLFNEYHALIVELGKRVCKKRPLCSKCILNNICPNNE